VSTTEIAKVGIELAGKATARPWATENLGEPGDWTIYQDFDRENPPEDEITIAETGCLDAAFIVHACNNFEPLAKRVIELESELADAKAKIAELELQMARFSASLRPG